MSTFEGDIPQTVTYKPRVTNEIKVQPDYPGSPAPLAWQSSHGVQSHSRRMVMKPQSRDQVIPSISLILGILSVFFGCFFIGIPIGLGAIIAGGIGLKNEKNDPEKYGGRGLAMGGIITGAVGIAIGIVLIILISLG